MGHVYLQRRSRLNDDGEIYQLITQVDLFADKDGYGRIVDALTRVLGQDTHVRVSTDVDKGSMGCLILPPDHSCSRRLVRFVERRVFNSELGQHVMELVIFGTSKGLRWLRETAEIAAAKSGGIDAASILLDALTADNSAVTFGSVALNLRAPIDHWNAVGLCEHWGRVSGEQPSRRIPVHTVPHDDEEEYRLPEVGVLPFDWQ